MLGLLCGILSAYFAGRKGYNRITAFLLGMFLLLPIFIYMFLPEKENSGEK